MNIVLRLFQEKDLERLLHLVQNTIEVSLPESYPPGIVEHFKLIHSREHILNDAVDGHIVLAEQNGELLGTGTLTRNSLHRVYIHPQHQHRGIGSLIVQALEEEAINREVPFLALGANPLSRRFWESQGFIMQQETYVTMEDGQNLYYFLMEKPLFNE
jgi:GNAT superfamily N-acetyltransferase